MALLVSEKVVGVGRGVASESCSVLRRADKISGRRVENNKQVINPFTAMMSAENDH